VISLPRYQATCRYIKIPAKSSVEIEKIIPFQAVKYLPYPSTELVTSYQVISTDKEGYSHVNLNIVHKDIISRYLFILSSLGTKNFSIALSSYGLNNLYNKINPQYNGIIMVANIDIDYIELIVIAQKKLLFSRSFRINEEQSLEQFLAEEIKKTAVAYIKETGMAVFSKIVIFTGKNISAEELSSKISTPVEISHYWEKFNCLQKFTDRIKTNRISFASLMGFGLNVVTADLNILPEGIREANLRAFKRREFIKTAALAFLAIVVFSLAMAKDLNNKKAYKDKLESELNKIAKEARALEELEKRFSLLESQAKKRLRALDTLSELHKLAPQDTFITNFTYEDDSQITIRGQSLVLKSILELVSRLEKSNAFNNLSIKVRYATKKKNQTGEIIDFEIICLSHAKRA
jgi:hypothetical protein